MLHVVDQVPARDHEDVEDVNSFAEHKANFDGAEDVNFDEGLIPLISRLPSSAEASPLQSAPPATLPSSISLQLHTQFSPF